MNTDIRTVNEMSLLETPIALMLADRDPTSRGSKSGGAVVRALRGFMYPVLKPPTGSKRLSALI